MTETEANPLPPLMIDARGLSCPLPVLRLNKVLRDLPPGAEVVLLATDRAALKDVPAFCAAHGHPVETGAEADVFRFRIRKIA